MIYDIQKASIIKRLSAFILDAIMVLILASGCALALSAITHYDSYITAVNTRYAYYQEEYDMNVNITKEEYNALDDITKARYDEGFNAMNNDLELVKKYNMEFNLALIIITFSCLISIMIWEFLIPLIFKNGQTLGKKMFGVCLVRQDSVKISNLQLFVRALLGKYTIETMVPVLLIILILFNKVSSLGLGGLILGGGILLLEIILLIATKNHTFIHDLLASTVPADKSSQMIFADKEEMIKYVEEKQNKLAAKQKY